MHTYTAKRKSKRSRMLAAIHIAKDKARMCPAHQRLTFDLVCPVCGAVIPEITDDQYRDVLKRAIGKSSCADMGENELAVVLDVFVHAGFKPAQKYRVQDMVSRSKQGTARSIREMAPSILGSGWEARLNGYIEKTFGKQDLRFCTVAELRRVFGFLRGVAHHEEDQDHEDAGTDESTGGPSLYLYK